MKIFTPLKNKLRNFRDSDNSIIRLSVKPLMFLNYAFSFVKRFIMDEDFRAIALMKVTKPQKVHQTTSLTFMNRYPEIFSICQNYFAGKKDLKILSYGCSTGEEVLSLRAYFPGAKIIGAEINRRSLAVARKHSVDNNIEFIYSSLANLKNCGPYDLIFCMAVLQRLPHTIASKGITNLKKIYPFAKFNAQILQLDELLRSQGLLVIHFTQYSLMDTEVADHYLPYGDLVQDNYICSIFDQKSERLTNPAPLKSIYLKQ